jgi:hypothetical protein
VPVVPGPGGRAAERAAVWLDRDHRSWVVADAAADQPAAVACCRARSLALPREDELVAAVAQGLTAGLAVAGPMWTAGTRLDVSNQRYATTVEPWGGTRRRADVAARHVVVCVQR